MYAIILSTIAILARNTTAITMLTMHHARIIAKTIAVQTLILEDAADIEDNLVSILKGLIGQKVCVKTLITLDIY